MSTARHFVLVVAAALLVTGCHQRDAPPAAGETPPSTAASVAPPTPASLPRPATDSRAKGVATAQSTPAQAHPAAPSAADPPAASTSSAAPLPIPTPMAITLATGCKAYVTAVHDLCLDNITQGLAMSCSHQVAILGVLRRLAGGALPVAGDEGHDPASIQDTCTRYLAALHAERVKSQAAARVEAGPHCKSFAAHFQAQCLASLASHAWTGDCRIASTAFEVGRDTDSPEAICTLADSFLDSSGD